MARPEVSISASSVLVVGELCTIEIDVLPEKDLKVEFIDATLTCDQGWKVGSGKQQVVFRLKSPSLIHRVMGEGTLAGQTTARHTARFKLAPGTPPTHEIAPAWSRMRLRIHVSIPWRLDGRYDYDFVVRLPAPRHVQRTPGSIRSTPLSAPADKPRIELALASTRLIVGENLVGTCAVFHLDDSDPREVELSLVPMMKLHGKGRERERRGEEITQKITLPAGSAGKGIPFAIAIPSTLPPTFESASHAVAWWLVARSGSFFSKKVDVSIPIELVDAAASATNPALVSAPRLGDEAIASLFATWALEHGWRGGDPEDQRVPGEFSIERAVDEAEIHIAYAYRGEEGTFLVGRVHNPSLGLGLAVTPSSSLRHVFFKDIEVDIMPWDREHHVVARSATQSAPVVKLVVPVLVNAPELGTLVTWSDDVLVFELPVSAIDEDVIGGMASRLVAVATAVQAAERTIAPPPTVDVTIADWRALATWLAGHLTVGDLSIDGTLDAAPVSIGLVYDEDHHPLRVQVSVGSSEAASDELRKTVISLPRPARDVLGDVGAEKLVDRVTRWSTDVTNLRVIDGVASATLVLPDAKRVPIDARDVRSLVEGLRAVLVALEPDAGPYR